MRKAILIADPNAPFRAALFKALVYEGFFALEATDGRSAISTMDLVELDLIVLSSDIEFNGSNVYGIVESLADARHLPLVVLWRDDGAEHVAAGDAHRRRVLHGPSLTLPDVLQVVHGMLGTAGPAVA